MTKSRSLKPGYDEVLTANGMIPRFAENLAAGKPLPTLSEVLAEVLNGEVLDPTSKQRVKRIVELLRFQSGYRSQVASRFRSGRAIDLYMDALLNCNSDLNEMLLRYSVTPQMHPGLDAPTMFFFSSGSRDAASETAEAGAVMSAIYLSESGQIDGIRECFCGRFFIAGRIDQQHCSAKCRVREYQSSPEAKAKRREADRERYRLHNEGRVKQSKRRKNGPKKAR